MLGFHNYFSFKFWKRICVSILELFPTIVIKILKSDSHLPKKICFNKSLLQKMKNAFYFILKPLFILKLFQLLYGLFGYVERTA